MSSPTLLMKTSATKMSLRLSGAPMIQTIGCLIYHPMKKSCQDLEKNLGKFFQESGQKSSNTRFLHGFGTRILQDKKDSCKFEKLAWIWNRFLANLPNLETSWQDLARYF